MNLHLQMTVDRKKSEGVNRGEPKNMDLRSERQLKIDYVKKQRKSLISKDITQLDQNNSSFHFLNSYCWAFFPLFNFELS